MPQADQLKQQDKRLAGEATQAHEKVPTYQELLDSAIEDTFPASDPIAVGGATRILEPHTTLRDAKDWTLKPGSEQLPEGSDAPVGPPAEPTMSAPCPGVVTRVMTLQANNADAVQVRPGPCTIEQSEHRAVLSWTSDGQSLCGSMPIETYRERLADGSLRRGEDASDPGETS